MSLKKEDMRPGLTVFMVDVHDEALPLRVVWIVGQDPNGRWVGYCEDWVMKVSQIDDEDYEYMELKQ